MRELLDFILECFRVECSGWRPNFKHKYRAAIEAEERFLAVELIWMHDTVPLKHKNGEVQN